MEQLEDRIRSLAQPLWDSSARPYALTVDCWLVAEQMVLEMMHFVTRIQARSLEPTTPLPTFIELPAAVPLERIRALAECMWDSAGRQYGLAQDFWLAAERHVLAMMRAATVLQGPDSPSAAIAELAALPPDKYLERIRVTAFELWESAGQSSGRAFEYWLEAERRTLEMMANISAASGVANATDPSMSTNASAAIGASVSTATPTRSGTGNSRKDTQIDLALPSQRDGK